MPAPTKLPINPGPPKVMGQPRRRPTLSEKWVDDLASSIDSNVMLDIQQMRKRLNMSQADLSKLLGREKNWLSRLERGNRRIFASDMLLLMETMRALERDHPGVMLLDRYSQGQNADHAVGATAAANQAPC